MGKKEKTSAEQAEEDYEAQSMKEFDLSDVDIVSAYSDVKKDDLTLQPLGFWGLPKTLRIHVLLMPAIIVFLICVIVLILTLFYLVPIWDPVGHLHNVEIRIYSQDTGYNGTNIPRLFMDYVNTHPDVSHKFKWNFVFGEEAQKASLATMEEDMLQRRYWSGMFFGPRYTATTVRAYTEGGHKWSTTTNTIPYIKDEVRQYNTATVIDLHLSYIISDFDLELRKYMHKTYTRAPTAPSAIVFNPFALDTRTIHTMGCVGKNFGNYVPFLALWLAMMQMMMIIRAAIRTNIVEGYNMSKASVYFWQFVTAFFGAFFAGLFAAVLIVGLGLPTKNGFGQVFGLFFFVALSFAGIVNFLLTLVSVPGLAISIFCVILQFTTSDGVYLRDTFPVGMRWIPPVFPFYHGVQLLRAAVYGASMNLRGLHVAAIFIWIVGSWALSFVCDYFYIGKKLACILFPVQLKGYNHFVNFLE